MSRDQRQPSFCSIIQSQRGFTLVELLVTVALFGAVMGIVSSEFFFSTRRSLDQKTIAKAQEQARTLLDTISFDIRMAGAGMPIGQTNFAFSQAEVGEAALPITLDSNGESISLLFNQKGINTITTDDVIPDSTRDFPVVDASDFEVGDQICISDITVGQNDGLCGVVEAIAGNTITVADPFNAVPGITLESGSEVHRISTVTYKSLALNA